jgi:diaphanous 1
MKRFASSVQNTTGQAIDVVAGDQSARAVVEEELEVLRARVEELSDEVWLPCFAHVRHVLSAAQKSKLRDEFNEQTAEVTILRSLPLNIGASPPRRPSNGGQEVCGTSA